MEGKLIINGGYPLRGSVRIGGAKNASLPAAAAALLSTEKVTLKDVPPLEDVTVMCKVMQGLGVEIAYDRAACSLEINAARLKDVEIPYSLTRKMRASFLVSGPLLGRTGRARVSLPGGCAIGERPVDLHLKGLQALGAEVRSSHGQVELLGSNLQGAEIYLDFPSVGATENILMAASLATGKTVIENAAAEPEVADLAKLINAMGGKVEGAGTDTISIQGVSRLHGATHTVQPDRIEAGTYMVAAAITGGDISIENIIPAHLVPLIAKLREAGCRITETGNKLRIQGGDLQATHVKTMPYPGFPTDLQSPVMSLLTLARGTSVVTETVFENRFLHVGELRRMGALIKIEGNSAIITGRRKLFGAPVRATDLRAGASLVVAGLAALGRTEIFCTGHIDRGYWRLQENLARLGASIQKSGGSSWSSAVLPPS